MTSPLKDREAFISQEIIILQKLSADGNISAVSNMNNTFLFLYRERNNRMYRKLSHGVILISEVDGNICVCVVVCVCV